MPKFNNTDITKPMLSRLASCPLSAGPIKRVNNAPLIMAIPREAIFTNKFRKYAFFNNLLITLFFLE